MFGLNMSIMSIAMGIVAGAGFCFICWSKFDEQFENVSTWLAVLLKLFLSVCVGVGVAIIMSIGK